MNPTRKNGQKTAKIWHFEQVRQAEDTCGEHDRDRHQECKPCGCGSLEVAQHTAGDGGSGARNTREDGECLENANNKRIEPCHLLQFAAAPAEKLCCHQEQGCDEKEDRADTGVIERGVQRLSLRNTPANPAGIVARMRYHPIRASPVSNGLRLMRACINDRMIFHRSFLK